MLVLSRKRDESIIVGKEIGADPILTVKVVAITGGRVKLGFEVRRDLLVHRMEVWERLTLEESASLSETICEESAIVVHADSRR